MFQVPLLALHLPKSHTEAIMHIPQIVTYTVREKGMEYKREQRWALMQALELLQLAKRHISGQSDVEQWKNQACSYGIAIIELRLSERISKGVSESAGQ